MQKRRPGRSPLNPSSLTLIVLFGSAVFYGSVALASPEGSLAVSTQLRLWWMASAAVLATITPHVLFPDAAFTRALLTAPTPVRLVGREMRRAAPLLMLLALPPVVVPIAGGLAPDDWLVIGGAGVLGVLGMWWLALQAYIRLGAVSQLWQEGTRGAWFESSGLRARMPIAMPRGSYPVLGATAGLFLMGAGAAVAWGVFDRLGLGYSGWIPATALLALAAIKQKTWLDVADAFIFRTQAFFNEMYRAFGAARESDREPLPVASLYWVPGNLRPAVWAQLRQMDRRLPLGRVIFASLILVWLLIYTQGYGTPVIAVLALISLSKNAAPFLLSGPDAAPPGLHLRFHGVGGWVFVRFFMSLRWTLPFGLALLIASLFAATLPIHVAVAWIILDAALALASGVVLAVTVENAYRRRFA